MSDLRHPTILRLIFYSGYFVLCLTCKALLVKRYICSLLITMIIVFFYFQDDIVMGTLTVRENFTFSANLRLPDNLSQKEKRHRVEETIQELGLTSCANTKVSNILQLSAKITVKFELIPT